MSGLFLNSASTDVARGRVGAMPCSAAREERSRRRQLRVPRGRAARSCPVTRRRTAWCSLRVCTYVSVQVFEELLLQALRRKQFLKRVLVSCEVLFFFDLSEFSQCSAAEGEASVTGWFGSFVLCFTLYL